MNDGTVKKILQSIDIIMAPAVAIEHMIEA